MNLSLSSLLSRPLSVAAAFVVLSQSVMAEDSGSGAAPTEAKQEEKKEAKAPVNKEGLTLPGLEVRLKERCVDIEARVCLEVGMLELIVCSQDTKEHEAVLAVEAKAAHIHAALLLLGAKPGHPAMRKPINEERTRWVDLPPRGGEIDVFLVFENEEGQMEEHPISKFLIRAEDDFTGPPQPGEEEPDRSFPTHTFLFAGSHVFQKEGRPAQYLADESGNVISLATFGDELLCLPGVHAHANGGLVWEVDSTHLPKVDTKVTLRLRPRIAEEKPKAPGVPPEKGAK